jgi:hypothetical protein
MRAWWLVAVGVGAFIGVVLLCQLAVVAVLRAFRIRLPFSLLFRLYTRKEPELIEAQEGWSEGIYVLISGFLLLACPLFAGLVAYDYIDRRYIDHLAYNASSVVGLAVVFVLLVIGTRWKSVKDWEKLRANSLPR